MTSDDTPLRNSTDPEATICPSCSDVAVREPVGSGSDQQLQCSVCGWTWLPIEKPSGEPTKAD